MRLPLYLLFGVLALTSVVIVWLTLASQSYRPSASSPSAKIGLGDTSAATVETRKPAPSPSEKDDNQSTAGLSPPPQDDTDARGSERQSPEENENAHVTAEPVRKVEPPKVELNTVQKQPTAVKPSTRAETQPETSPAPAVEAEPPVAPQKPPAADEQQSAALPPPPAEPNVPSVSAPADPTLIQQSALGPLPKIGADGRKPWHVYARPFSGAGKRLKIAIVITGLGLSSAATEAAIQGLPGQVTLAFAPYGDRLDHWIRLARAAGHEVLLNVPMEPLNYPTYDPGPQALLTSLSPKENRERLMWSLSRVTGYVGVIDFMGSRFTMSRQHLLPVFDVLQKRGLLFVDSHTAPRTITPTIATEIGLPWVLSSRTIDAHASREAIDSRLNELIRIAKKDGKAVGIGSPYPVTMERIAVWIDELDRGHVVLAPISALAKEARAQ